MARSVIANNGKLIKRKIKEAGLTQQKFATDLGYELRSVQKWLKVGVHDYELIFIIADYFEINPLDLMCE